jgi:hypothetical protein
MESNSNDYFNLKIDNELKKKEFVEKYGAVFGDEEAVSPEIECEWLKNIELYEQLFEEADKTTVYEYMGEPQYKALLDLRPDEILPELERLYQLLDDSNISLETLSDVDDIELYRFITEELFLCDIDNIEVPGITSGYIYEEFHPNSELDIEEAFDYFFRITMGKVKNIGHGGYDMLYVDTKHYQNAEDVVLEEKQVLDRINNFLSAFDSFEIVSIEITDFKIDDEKQKALVRFRILYKGLFENKKSIEYKGEGCFKLKPSEYGGWNIYHITLPGLDI